jgi:V/A-type H+-transporting ATPase subunit C
MALPVLTADTRVADVQTLPGVVRKIGSWRFGSAFIRAREHRLMDETAIQRLFQSESEEAVARLLQEADYPQGDIDEVLINEEFSLDRELRSVSADERFWDTLALFRDAHNLKAILKTFASRWSEQKPHLTFDQVADMMLYPAFSPEKIFTALAEDNLKDLPTWLAAWAADARQVFRKSYDYARIDQVIDRLAHEEVDRRARLLGNAWFWQYLALTRDLKNIEILLRMRRLALGKETFERTLLPAGYLQLQDLSHLFSADDQQIAAWLSTTPYESFALYVEKYSEKGGPAGFSRAVDEHTMEHLRRAHHTVNGPEVLLAYGLARQMEIRNVRIALSCIKNSSSAEQRTLMMRSAYIKGRG